MKKRIISAVMSLIMLITCIGITIMVSAEDTEPTAETFDTQEVGTIPAGWELRSDGAATAGGIAEEGENKFLRLNSPVSGGTSRLMSPLATSNRFSMEFDLRISQIETDTNIGLIAYDGDGKKGYYRNAIKWWSKANLRRFDNINDGSAYGTDEGVVQNNQWVHVKYVASCTGADDEDAYVKVYINDKLYAAASGGRFATKGVVSRLEILRIGTANAVTIDIDNMLIKDLTEMEYKNLYWQTDYSGDFEGLAEGATPEEWVYDYDKNTPTGSAKVMEENGNQYLRMEVPAGSKSWILSPEAKSTKFQVEFKLRLSNTTQFTHVSLVSPSGVEGYGGWMYGVVWDKNFKIDDGRNHTSGKILENDTWYKIKYIVDSSDPNLSNFNVGVFIDDQPYATSSGNYFKARRMLNRLKIMVEKPGEGVTVDIDDVEVKDLTESNGEMEINFIGAELNNPGTYYRNGLTRIGNTLGDKNQFEPVNGKFGKAADDRSLYIHRPEGKYATSEEAFLQVYTEQMYEANKGKVSAGNESVVSFNFAFNESMSPLEVVGAMWSEDNGGDGKIGWPLLYIKKDGSVSVLGTSLSFNRDAFRPNVWYNVKLAMYAGDNSTEDKNKFSLYINNEPVAENVPFRDDVPVRGTGNAFAKRNLFRGIRQLWFNCKLSDIQQGEANEDGTLNCSDGGFYIDDIRLSNSVGVSYEPLRMSMSHSNAATADLINYPYVIYADDDLMTVEQVSEVKVTNGELIAVVDADGNEAATGSANGKYLRLKDLLCEEFYIPVTKAADLNYTYTAEQLYAKAVNPNNVEGGWLSAPGGTWFKWGGFADESAAYAENVAGKSSKSIKLGAGKLEKDQQDILNFMVKNSNERLAGAYEPMTIEANVYSSSPSKAIQLWAYPDGKTGGGDVRMLWSMDGNQINCFGNRIEDCQAGRWYKIAIVLYPRNDKISAYINGKKVADGTFDYNYINMLRFTASDGENVTDDDFAAIDNFKMKNGVYAAENSANITVNEDVADIVEMDSTTNTITLKEELEVEFIDTILNLDGIEYTLYSDATCQTKVTSGNISNGNVLVAVKNNIYSYYTIKAPTTEPGESPEPRNDITYKTSELSDDGDKKVVTISGIDNATDKDINVAVMVATYDAEGRLVSVGMEKVKVNANTKHDGDVSARAVFTAGNSVKYFVWDIDTLKPIEKLD